MRIPKFQKWDAVQVTWVDSVGFADGWAAVTEEDTNIHGCVTVGQVFAQSRDRITLVLSYDHSRKHADGAITIPTVAITAVQKLQ